VLAANHVVVNGEFVVRSTGLLLFRIEEDILVFALLLLAKFQIALFGRYGDALKRIGMRLREPDTDFLSGGHILHGEGIVEAEVSFCLGMSGKRYCEESKNCESSAQHGQSFLCRCDGGSETVAETTDGRLKLDASEAAAREARAGSWHAV